MYKEEKWDLSVVKPKNVDATLKEIEQQANAIVKRRNHLTNSISSSSFMKLLKDLESLRKKANKLSCYTYLRFSEDSKDQHAAALMSKVESHLTKVSNTLLFFNLWFKKLPQKKALQLIKQSGPYHYYLESIRRGIPHTLTEPEEKIINIKDVTGASALNNIYDIFTSQFEFTFQGKQITQEELTSHVRSPKASVRKEAYLTLLNPYKKHKDVIGEIYKNIATDWRNESVELRGHKTPIAVRNFANNIPDKAIDAMLTVCEKNQKLFHQFFELKRKKLKLKKLRRFDVYAPLSTKKEAKISYNKAVEMVYDTFSSFSPRFQKAAQEIIDQKQVHSTVQKNKRSGAYCCGVTNDLPPFVFLNYTGTIRDVSTLAHELGHGVHHILARHHTEFTQHACLPLAETASIFSEMLLSERIKHLQPHKAEELLFAKLDDLYASIIRQAGFVAFERKAHDMIAKGKTIQDISDVYLKDLKKQLGPKVEVDDIYQYEWCYIPHIFHTPFYCYAYAFGNLLTLSLYQMYHKEGPKAVPHILEMLSKGGSESPVDITKAVGVDITSEKFWQQGFDAIRDMLKQIT